MRGRGVGEGRGHEPVGERHHILLRILQAHPDLSGRPILIAVPSAPELPWAPAGGGFGPAAEAGVRGGGQVDLVLEGEQPNSRSVDAANSSPLGTFARSSSALPGGSALSPGGEEEDGPAGSSGNEEGGARTDSASRPPSQMAWRKRARVGPPYVPSRVLHRGWPARGRSR